MGKTLYQWMSESTICDSVVVVSQEVADLFSFYNKPDESFLCCSDLDHISGKRTLEGKVLSDFQLSKLNDWWD